MKVLFIINYAQADRAWELWQTGQARESPAQNLWGITHLKQYGIDVDLLPYEAYKSLRDLGNKLKLGNLDQQYRTLQLLSQYDLIYSASQTDTLLLSLLRASGLLKKPLVVKLERPFKVNLFSKVLLKVFAQGHDKILCLSSRVEDQLKDEFGIESNKLVLLDWGPDLVSYDEYQGGNSAQNPSTFIMSAGNTNRDYNTLVAAATPISYPLHIYCSEASAPKVAPLPEQINVYYKHPTSTTALTWQDLVMEYEQAYAIAIPLEIPANRADNTPLYGLTSLLDAMAMGKASIMTYHRQVNIDVEKEGIGLWVQPGDVDGWRRALTYLLDNPQETAAMGKRARQLSEQRYNLNAFTAQLAKALQSAARC